MPLTIAVDETGNFRGPKLAGEKSKSGVAIVGTNQSSEQIDASIKSIAQRYGVSYPAGVHASELLENGQIAAYNAFDSEMRKAEVFRCGVYGKRPPGRVYFHEQQAYGEMLLAALAIVPKRFSPQLREADAIDLVVATRAKVELMGFMSDEQGIEIHDREQVSEAYHLKLKHFIEEALPKLGWPDNINVMTRSANWNMHLKLPDFACKALGAGDHWWTPIEEVSLPMLRGEVRAFLGLTDPVGFALYVFKESEALPNDFLNALPLQTAITTLHGLLSAAHALVQDRFGIGSLPRALSLAEALWPLAEHFRTPSIQAELCAIAFEALSHSGDGDKVPASKLWRERAQCLPQRAWGTNAPEIRAQLLELHCQTVQVDRFNVFAFEKAYDEFVLIEDCYRHEYEKDGIDPGDELYGKILGTLGQAMGFLKPQFPEFIPEILPILERSKPCFEFALPDPKNMNLGFRLTELWDNGQLDELQNLMRTEHLASTHDASPYDLLHRFRCAALQQVKQGQDSELVARLISRLLDLCSNERALGQTPHDLCLKWALFLRPGHQEIVSVGRHWLEQLADSHGALLATSLPLAMQLGELDRARAAVAVLMGHPGFLDHWATPRAKKLRGRLESGDVQSTFDYEELRGMPWNYA